MLRLYRLWSARSSGGTFFGILFVLTFIFFTHSSHAVQPLRVTATTSMVADLVQNVGGDLVRVEALMGPGVDPHLYKATAKDVLKLQKADIIFYSGLLLEGKMEDLFTQMAKRKKKVYAVTEGLGVSKLLKPATYQGHPDPHVWFDVELWAQCIDTVVKGLSEAAPSGAKTFKQNGEAYRQKLNALHQWAVKKASELPKEKRILITSHDAFSYFGRAYGFQVVGLQGISTVTEAGLADMTSMVDFIKKTGVKAVFVESSVSPAALQRISTDAGVKIGGELFSDAMGTPGQMEDGYDVGTYLGMIRHNLNTVVQALQ
ncbi:MAG: metal ABC transporter solute-binding protein, Zn/Mn family [Verrucomicrobiales bacterium]